jgi:hypothetical protein
MSRLVDFYRGQAPDNRGRTIQSIWAWNDALLEAVHDFIQWLFPLPEPSKVNASAPLLTEEEIAIFSREPLLQTNLHRSYERILTFLGLHPTPEGRVEEGTNFRRRAPDVWNDPNHNWLRITRILRSLTLLGLHVEAEAFYDCLERFYRGNRFPISAETFEYWTAAVRGPAPKP